MKKTLTSLLFLSIFLFIVGCSIKPDQTDLSKVVSKPSEIREKPTIEQIVKSSNFMLIQSRTEDFPQIQGVYDLKNNELTIVKQYAPKKSNNITNDNTIDLNQPAEVNPILEDVHSTFPGLEYDSDPFKVYEKNFNHLTIQLTTTQLIIEANQNIKKVFTFTDDSKRSVIDNNGVIYQISYGS